MNTKTQKAQKVAPVADLLDMTSEQIISSIFRQARCPMPEELSPGSMQTQLMQAKLNWLEANVERLLSELAAVEADATGMAEEYSIQVIITADGKEVVNETNDGIPGAKLVDAIGRLSQSVRKLLPVQATVAAIARNDLARSTRATTRQKLRRIYADHVAVLSELAQRYAAEVERGVSISAPRIAGRRYKPSEQGFPAPSTTRVIDLD